MEATALMWLSIHPEAVNDLWLAAIAIYDDQAKTEDRDSILSCAALSFDTQARNT